MDLSTRPSGHASACYAPQLDYHHRFENRYGLPGAGGPRQPLERSTGNVQLRHTPTLPSTGPAYSSSQQQHLDAYSTIQSSIPTPPVIPSQVFSSVYGPQPAQPATRVPERRRTHHVASPYYPNVPMTLLMMTRNPLARAPQFANYRAKQDSDKASGASSRGDKKQKWPDVLEAACLDALLLVPLTMGKKKVGKKEDDGFKQFGRNELIERYLWFAYLDTLPPGAAADPNFWIVECRIATEDNKEKGKGRKKVSSHIQVLKNFFRSITCYHFIFTTKMKAVKAPAASAASAGKALESSKDHDFPDNLGLHPVVYALVNENRLPAERPNYEYYAQLLGDDQFVSVRPRRCWIFVAHADYVVTAHEGPPDKDGNPGDLTFTAHNPVTGLELSHPEDYPYLKENVFKDSWPREERSMVPGTLLHQLTKSLEQVESSSVSQVGSQWDITFPELAARLHNAVEESGGYSQEPGLPNPNRCEFLHMHLTLELQRRRHFPAQSELNSWVEISVEQPHLLNHRWKVETRLVRPAELVRGADDNPLTHIETEMGVLYVHRPSCEAGTSSSGNSGHECDCLSQRSRRQVVSVPFPADVAARMLTYCTEYPPHPLSPRAADRSGENPSGQAGSKSERGGRTRSKKTKSTTQMDLLPQVAMFQEIYSCPPEESYDGQDPDRETDHVRKTPWKRRAVLMWTFETIHSIIKKDGKEELQTLPSGKGTWRFLTPLDPTSQQHQQRSMVLPTQDNTMPPRHSLSMSSGPPTSRHLSRDSILSPTPSYQQHLTASMSENFSTVWDTPATRPNGIFTFTGNPALQQGYDNGQNLYQTALTTPTGPGGLSILPSQHRAGLATPPPTSSLSGSFAHSFDDGSQHGQPHDMRNQSLSFMSVGSSSTDTDPYLGSTANGSVSYGYDAAVPDDFSGWVTAANASNPLPAVDTRLHPGYWQPQPQYASRTASHSHLIDWAVPSPHDSPIVGTGVKDEVVAMDSHHVLGDKWKALPPSTILTTTDSGPWGPQKEDPSPASGDTSPRPLTSCSGRESQETPGSWVNVGAAGRTPSTDMSQEWEAVEQRGEVEGMKGDGTQQQQFVGGGYFQDMAQGEGQGHEEQYERFRSHKRRRTRLDDYNSCMEPPRMKMARSEVGDGAQ